MPRWATTNSLQEIESRVNARAFAAVMAPTKGPALREVLERLAAVLDKTSEDGVIWWPDQRRRKRGDLAASPSALNRAAQSRRDPDATAPAAHL